METYKLANRADFIEGAAEARNLIYTLADEITSASIPSDDGSTVPSKWEEEFRSEGSLFVDYEQNLVPNTIARYKHTDGELYDIQKIKLSGSSLVYSTDDYKFLEVNKAASQTNSTGAPTGYELNYNPTITYTDLNGNEKTKQLYVDQLLFSFIPDATTPYGYAMYILEQGYLTKNDLGEDVFFADENWDGFYKVAVITDEDIIKFAEITFKLLVHSFRNYSTTTTEYYIESNKILINHKFDKMVYSAEPVKQIPGIVVLKATPDVPVGISEHSYYVMMKQSPTSYNYFDISYGVGFQLISEATGNPSSSYIGICDLATVKDVGTNPVIIDQIACHVYFKSTQGDTPAFKAVEYTWELDITGTKEMVSPTSHYFYGRDSTTSWVINKKRRPDYLVRYWLSVNNNRAALVIEGDPAPSISDYYRSFGYIGKITPFNQYDHAGNFGLTVGMGHLESSKTGFVESDIKEDTPEYGWWGEYTSNGMWSMSMFNTRSNVFFQSHHPAFLTQLPNYDAAGTVPPPLKRLILDDDQFQPSVWSSKYHGSPIYLVHRADGYRGFMDGVVVVEDHNIVNGDELVVDTHILKDSSDPSKGTWTEVYKFFSVNTPVNLFSKYSPAPGKVSVAILKDIK